ncbi:hypothetical protein GCM10010923_15840 [Blastomonas marina]|uniref:Uncharacterized protein n=1 Tax=Blastomonas marina TaxID=1867408 RepID=A0ABQ1FD75_9SPHN|nr:hypothetical protein GCM10010923_15840 [Blastomonas marina]
MLVLAQLIVIAKGDYALHRRVGLAVLLVGPVIVATVATLSVYSAKKGAASGEGDFLIVQNVMVTLELALLIVLAFLFKKRRILHGHLLLSTLILFGGIALFFALIGFVPQFRIEGPETFYRFGLAAMTGQLVCLSGGLALFLLKSRDRWPFLLVGASFFANEGIRLLLERFGLIDGLTATVGSLDLVMTFVAVLLLVGVLLTATVLPVSRTRRALGKAQELS